MAFNQNNWGRWSVSYNSFPPTMWTYTGLENGEDDTLAILKADGFFDPVESVLDIGHLIFLRGKLVAPVTPSDELVVVKELDPIKVIPLVGAPPLLIVQNSISTTPTATPATQSFNLSGLLVNDIPMMNISNNPSGVRILSTVVNASDEFTITFDIDPGVGVNFEGLFFRPAFLP